MITGVVSDSSAPRGDALPPAVLSTKQAAAYLGLAVPTLRTWRHRRIGPASFRMGGHVVYRLRELDSYLDACEAADSRSNPELNPLNRVPRPKRDRSGRRVEARCAA